jgi:hypothetical protein
LLPWLQRNKAGQQIMVSHYLPMNTRTRDDKLPVVVYCHCNSGSRRDAEEAVWHLLPCGVGVVAFDFTVSVCGCTVAWQWCKKYAAQQQQEQQQEHPRQQQQQHQRQQQALAVNRVERT